MLCLNRPHNMHGNEQYFLDSMADPQKTYIYQPCTFHFARTGTYRPDFYCKEDDTYIEVLGTRQAHDQNKHKYKQMAKEYPAVKLILISVTKWSPRGKDRTNYRVAGSNGMYVSDIAERFFYSINYIRILLAKKGYTRDIDLAIELSKHAHRAPITFINPKWREQILLRHPNLSEIEEESDYP